MNDSNLKFEEECLKAHNEYRTLHGVEPLKLNKKMCKESQEWAKHLACKGVAEHRKNTPYGENIYLCWSSNPSYTITGTCIPYNTYNILYTSYYFCVK